MQKKFLKNKKGFTIIETMIAISVFLIVVTIGMGALLNAKTIHQKSQDMRSIMDNLSFIMEEVSRNLKTGSVYHCIDDGIVSATLAHSCINGGGISFKTQLNQQWVYAIYGDGSIKKSTDSGNDMIILNEPSILLDTGLSGFTVIGAQPGDNQQPFVIIRLVGKIIYKGVDTEFNLQTSASQRLLDL